MCDPPISLSQKNSLRPSYSEYFLSRTGFEKNLNFISKLKILSSSQFKYTITHSVWWVIFGAFFVCDLFWPWLGWLTEKIRKPAFHSILSKTINFCKNIVSTQAYFFSDDINPLFWTRIILILGLSALKIETNWSELFKKHSLV